MTDADALHKRRTQTMQEIVDTENDYLSNLMTLNLIYLRPIKALLEENPRIVNENLRVSLLSIRSDIEVILGIQKQFMSELSQRTKQWNETTLLGDIFILFADALKTYFSYMNHYQTVIPLLSQTHGTEFARKLNDMKKPSCRGKGLRDFLIMPAQRIPRYLMLLIDLLKRTPEDHPDYNNLTIAKQKYSELSDKVDQDLADFKSLETVMQLSATLVFKKKEKNFPLVAPHRRFVKELNVSFLRGNHEGNCDNLKEGHLIIFNDLLVVCTQVDKQHQRKVKFIQLFEDIILYTLKVRGKEALCIKLDPDESSAISIWPTEADVDILGIITNAKEQRNQGTKSNSTTVPVKKAKFEPPKMTRSHSSFSIESVNVRKARSKSHSKLISPRLRPQVETSLSSSRSMDKIAGNDRAGVCEKPPPSPLNSKSRKTKHSGQSKKRKKRYSANSLPLGVLTPIPDAL